MDDVQRVLVTPMENESRCGGRRKREMSTGMLFVVPVGNAVYRARYTPEPFGSCCIRGMTNRYVN